MRVGLRGAWTTCLLGWVGFACGEDADRALTKGSPTHDAEAAIDVDSEAPAGVDAAASAKKDAGSEAPAGVDAAASDEDDFIYADVVTVLEDTDLGSWVSLSNQISVVSVLGETQLPEPPAAAETNALVGRNIHLKLDENLWVPSSAASELIPQGAEFTMAALGWVYSEGKLLRFAARNAVRLEVGGTYIAPLVEFQDSVDGWGVLTPASVMPLPGSDVAESDAERHDAGNSTTSQLKGLDLAELEQALADAEMDPDADACRSLPGVERSDCLEKP